MASSLVPSWQIDGENVETVSDFIFLGSKINAHGDCSHEIKRPLLLGRIAITNLDRVLKSRDITLPTKIHIVKAVVLNFSVAVKVITNLEESCPSFSEQSSHVISFFIPTNSAEVAK